MVKNIWCGVTGGLIVCLIGFVVFIIFNPINTAPVYMLNTNCITDSIQHHALDSLQCAHLEALADLEQKGLLLSPADYTSHISSYYNGLIAFLIGIFVFFTISGIFAVRLTSKREFEELKQEVHSSTQNHILEQLQRMMSDSKSFQETTITALMGRFDDHVVKVEELEDLQHTVESLTKQMSAIDENMQTLYDLYNEIEDRSAANQTITED